MVLGSTQPLTEMSTKIYPRGKGGRYVGLTSPSSCADCLEISETRPPGTLRACPGLLQGLLYLCFKRYSTHPHLGPTLKKRLSFIYKVNGNHSLVVIRAVIRVEGKHCECNAKRTLSTLKTSTVRMDVTNPKYLRNTKNGAWRFRGRLAATTPYQMQLRTLFGSSANSPVCHIPVIVPPLRGNVSCAALH
jgi:hypothetical protein